MWMVDDGGGWKFPEPLKLLNYSWDESVARSVVGKIA
jgi:hypothetical protein